MQYWFIENRELTNNGRIWIHVESPSHFGCSLGANSLEAIDLVDFIDPKLGQKWTFWTLWTPF